MPFVSHFKPPPGPFKTEAFGMYLAIFVDMFYAVRTGEQNYFKCACQKCGKRIEFPSNGAGTTVECPHCHDQTVLGVARNSQAATSFKKNRFLLAAVGLVVGIVVAGLGIFLWIKK
jgi:uncharacterized paraquat-inducible protein A